MIDQMCLTISPTYIRWEFEGYLLSLFREDSFPYLESDYRRLKGVEDRSESNPCREVILSSCSTVRNSQLALPPISEQKKIVTVRRQRKRDRSVDMTIVQPTEQDIAD
jgi:hypothetical protein